MEDEQNILEIQSGLPQVGVQPYRQVHALEENIPEEFFLSAEKISQLVTNQS
ncbi:Uncharacterised protein [Streptococcus pneumoniae]|nr:Uncharacterised protein [Streptococcus pneumoniae]VOI21989.1 Uncharacterised protein [Streptococcus pneumoniae]